MAVHEHKKHARTNFKVGVITASDTRTSDDDSSGRLIRKMLEDAGHQVTYREIIPDERAQISEAILRHLPSLDAVIVTGGTGIAPRDSTIEAVRPLLDNELEDF